MISLIDTILCRLNWETPGYQALKLLISKHHLYFGPIEKPLTQTSSSVASEAITLSEQLKPELRLQMVSFIQDGYNQLTSRASKSTHALPNDNQRKKCIKALLTA